jgi:16S rRNA G1207 methylase RsmC
VRHLEPDPYFKKTVTLRQGGSRLDLRVAGDLFSSFEVDVGTRLLLRTLADAGHPGLRVLDLGCGYGPIGLTLASLDPERRVHLVDRDALAVAYTRANVALNGLAGVEAYGSLGYDDVTAADFDLVVSNIPAKAGTRAVGSFLLDAAAHLAPAGLVAVVVVAPLEPVVAGILDGQPEVEVVHRRRTASYAVFHYRFGAGPGGGPRPARASRDSALDRGVYDRADVAVEHAGVRVAMRTAYGLPEFDSLSYQSELAVDALARQPLRGPGRTVVLNPGQGHLPTLLWRILEPPELLLVDRDLLALRYARANLVRNGCPAEQILTSHQVGLDGAAVAGADLVVAALREKEPPEAAAASVRLAATELPPGGRLVVAGSSTAVTRCLARLPGDRGRVAVRDRRRKKGFSAVVLEAVGAGRP